MKHIKYPSMKESYHWKIVIEKLRKKRFLEIFDIYNIIIDENIVCSQIYDKKRSKNRFMKNIHKIWNDNMIRYYMTKIYEINPSNGKLQIRKK
jgi:hypothetical protein